MTNDRFANDILEGLRASPKYLLSKYFYDETGDKIFQDIMHSPEYYLTNCEYEILSMQRKGIVQEFLRQSPVFDLVELGAGDCFKSRFLLQELLTQKVDFTFFPIDISANVITLLNERLPREIHGLKMQGLNGEYFSMLEKVREYSDRPMIVLFLGSNIGNMEKEKARSFLRELRRLLRPDDLLFMGFDLKKDPRTILSAYNDRAGITRAFNLNLLHRINIEFGGNFDLTRFEHFPTYDPVTGSCRSYLISKEPQQVSLAALNAVIAFEKDEPLYMEISQKYSPDEIRALATDTGFGITAGFFDCKHWFLDSLWRM